MNTPNTSIRSARTLLLGLALTLSAISCSKTNVYIENGGDYLPSGRTALVSFQATVESRNVTRSMSPIRKDVQVGMYAYSTAATESSASPVAQGIYQSATIGQLTGIGGYKMFLPGGTYNIYGVSTNSATAPPSFSNMLSEPLVNGVDYLWWSGKDVGVITSQINIPIVLVHSSTQLVLEVTPGDGITIDELVSVHTFAPLEGERMNLATGVITPAIKQGQGFTNQMGINGLIAQSILLPYGSNTPLPAVLEVKLNGENTIRQYAVEIPTPSNGLTAGNSYRYKMVLNGNSVTFPSVNVIDWVDVDETGKPLYPTPVDLPKN